MLRFFMLHKRPDGLYTSKKIIYVESEGIYISCWNCWNYLKSHLRETGEREKGRSSSDFIHNLINRTISNPRVISICNYQL